MPHLHPLDLRPLVGLPRLRAVTAGLGSLRKNARHASCLGCRRSPARSTGAPAELDPAPTCPASTQGLPGAEPARLCDQPHPDEFLRSGLASCQTANTLE